MGGEVAYSSEVACDVGVMLHDTEISGDENYTKFIAKVCYLT